MRVIQPSRLSLLSRKSRTAMAARIVSLRPQAAPDPAPVSIRAPAHRPAERTQDQHGWRGASGRVYAHRVYGLIECPPLPPAGYVLVRRDEQGRRTPLRVGVGTSDAPTVNLAEVRRLGAQAGANEVHVRLDVACDAECRLVACDLRAGLFGTLAAAAGPTSALRPAPGPAPRF
jgi:hypothetical protein